MSKKTAPAAWPGQERGENELAFASIIPLKRSKCSGIMHLMLCFMPDGETNFYPEAENPAELAIRLAEIVDLLHEHPHLIIHAAGACGGDRHGRD